MADLLAGSLESVGFPLAMAFAPDGRVFLSERVGRLWEIKGDAYRVMYHFSTVPLLVHNETGLLGIALDPDFTETDYIYCYYTTGTNASDMKNRVVRLKVSNPVEEVLLDNIPAGLIHCGGILAFGPDKTLYIGVGVDDQVKEHAQDTARLDGKILRINRDGSIPADNPFPGSPVYSWGHRNIFGLSFHPETGTGYICDVGPNRQDEINILEKGVNYGWPAEVGPTENKKTVNPMISYEHVITPTQCVAVDNYLYFGSYNEGTVHRLTLTGDRYDQVIDDRIVYRFTPFGIVGVFCSPDRQFYAVTPQYVINITKDITAAV